MLWLWTMPAKGSKGLPTCHKYEIVADFNFLHLYLDLVIIFYWQENITSILNWEMGENIRVMMYLFSGGKKFHTLVDVNHRYGHWKRTIVSWIWNRCLQPSVSFLLGNLFYSIPEISMESFWELETLLGQDYLKLDTINCSNALFLNIRLLQ